VSGGALHLLRAQALSPSTFEEQWVATRRAGPGMQGWDAGRMQHADVQQVRADIWYGCVRLKHCSWPASESVVAVQGS